MRQTAAWIAALAVTLAGAPVPTPAHAQEADYTGSWDLSLADSDFGNTRAPESARLEIRRADSRLVMTSVRDIGSGPAVVEIDIPTDGSRHTVAAPNGEIPISAEWDGDVLVVWRQAQANVGAVDVTERHHLEDDGQRMRVEGSVEVPGAGTFTSTMVFVRSGG